MSPPALLSQPIQMFISSRNTLIDMPEIMFNHISGYLKVLSIWHKINHHKVWLNLLSWQLAFFFTINEENEISKPLFIFW